MFIKGFSYPILHVGQSLCRIASLNPALAFPIVSTFPNSLFRIPLATQSNPGFVSTSPAPRSLGLVHFRDPKGNPRTHRESLASNPCRSSRCARRRNRGGRRACCNHLCRIMFPTPSLPLRADPSLYAPKSNGVKENASVEAGLPRICVWVAR